MAARLLKQIGSLETDFQIFEKVTICVVLALAGDFVLIDGSSKLVESA